MSSTPGSSHGICDPAVMSENRFALKQGFELAALVQRVANGEFDSAKEVMSGAACKVPR
jgi:hypothetical protein